MIEKQITVYECEFCKTKHDSKDWMALHEKLCPLNPKNQPCSLCEHQVLGFGCAKGMDMEIIGGNVKCFFYKRGVPKNPFDDMKIDTDIDPEI